MAAIIDNVVRRYRSIQAGFDDKLIFDWNEVLKEIQGFNKAIAKSDKAADAASMTAALKVFSKKTMGITLWLKQCTTRYPENIALARKTNAILKDGPESEMSSLLQDIKKHIQDALNSIAPEKFSYHGFTITNKQHIEEELCRRSLEGVDQLVALFKKRGVEKVLTGTLDCINLAVMGGAPNGVAYYGSIRGADVPEITLFSGPKASGTLMTDGVSTLIHEFGHHIYYTHLSSEAKAVWDAPWDANPKGGDILEVPTEYAKTNKFEDFADTFAIFMVNPERLSPTALYRMQRALSLSGLYGKPVMKLGDEEMISRVVVRFQSGV